MESTRSWLASAIEGEMEPLSRGLEAWLRADSSLGLGDRLGAVCPGAVRDLVVWLRGDHPAGPALPAERAASLARSFVLEFVKREGWLDRASRERRHEVLVLLETFFAERAAQAVGRNDP